MGLDVYLYPRAAEEASNAHEKAWEAWYEKYENTDENDPAAVAEKKAAQEALPKFVAQETVESEVHGKHLFNRRYLRSSYNASGFNRAVPDMVGAEHSLYWIFEPVLGGSEEYSFELTAGSVTALAEAKDRARQVAEEIRACDPLRAETISSMIGTAEHMWHEPPTEDQVLAWYREEKVKREANPPNAKSVELFGDDNGFSTAKGTVMGFKTGMEVLATTLGRDVMGQPAAILVYRLDDETKEHYAQAADITAEFCEEAIELIYRDGSVFMHWSG